MSLIPGYLPKSTQPWNSLECSYKPITESYPEPDMSSLTHFSCFSPHHHKGGGGSYPCTRPWRPIGLRRWGSHIIYTNGSEMVVTLSALHAGCALLPRKIILINSWIRSIEKKSSDLIGIWTRDLPACMLGLMTGEACMLWGSSLYNFLQTPTLPLSQIQIFSSPFSNTLKWCSPLNTGQQVSHPYKTTGEKYTLFF
jgi:hypothetical protein